MLLYMTNSTDGNGNTTRYEYDRAGRLVQKADRNGMITEYAFNLYGAPLYRRVKL